MGMNALTPGVTEKDPPLKKLTFEGGTNKPDHL